MNEMTNMQDHAADAFGGLRHAQLLAFDADDTLWDNQSYFESVERAYCDLLALWGTADEVSEALFGIETANMPLLGYGGKAFTISLVENALDMSGGRIGATEVQKIVALGKSLLSLPALPLPGVAATLRALRAKQRYKLVVFTKGETLDQQNKLKRSGLAPWFDDIVVVADKTQREYQRLCSLFDTDISRMVMVGNSFKSDIAPALSIGAKAIHIPFHTIWQHEQVEEYDHHNLRRIHHFGEIIQLLEKK